MLVEAKANFSIPAVRFARCPHTVYSSDRSTMCHSIAMMGALGRESDLFFSCCLGRPPQKAGLPAHTLTPVMHALLRRHMSVVQYLELGACNNPPNAAVMSAQRSAAH